MINSIKLAKYIGTFFIIIGILAVLGGSETLSTKLGSSTSGQNGLSILALGILLIITGIGLTTKKRWSMFMYLFITLINVFIQFLSANKILFFNNTNILVSISAWVFILIELGIFYLFYRDRHLFV